jgi:methionyl aminopeptidase
MTISNDDDLTALKDIGGIVARVLKAMAEALEPGMTTKELDDLGRKLLEAEGARSAPEVSYGFPGATCISINEEVAHGIPGPRVIQAGDLVNIDVSAEKGGYFADTGGSFAVPPVSPRVARLCRDGRRAMWQGIHAVKPGARLSGIGDRVERFARKNGYSLIRNLASHGTGRALHEEPGIIPTWRDPEEQRVIGEGMVFTVEPFLSTGAEWAEDTDDGWTLVTAPQFRSVQFEHTLVASRRGPIILTQPH